MLWSTLVREPTARKLNDRTGCRVAGDNPQRRTTITDVQPSSTNAHRGTVFTTNEVFNQDGERVMTLKARGFFARRAT